MVRKLAMAVALALGTATAPVHALGLGDIKSHSALNQAFDADIDLLSVPQGELDAVRVTLADFTAFERAGVDRSALLSALRFEPVRRDDGRAVIRVTSNGPIREPFLNFLIEVNWPRGRLVREYTVLLDPPTTTGRPAPQVTAPRIPQPAAPASTAPRSVGPAPHAASRPLQPAADEYGPIRSDETLWGIARSVRPNGVSMEQMMMALLDANPQAFIGGNINRLRKGQILRVPGREAILGVSRKAARDAYRDQQDAWLEQRSQRMQATAGQAAADAVPADTGRLKIATANPEGEGKAGSAENDVSAPTVQELEEKLLIARENAESTKQEADALRAQIDDLADRLLDMQKVIRLKDEQFAKLQAGIEEDTAQQEATQPVEQVAGDMAADGGAAAAPQAADGEPVADTVPPAVTAGAVVGDAVSEVTDTLAGAVESGSEPEAPGTGREEGGPAAVEQAVQPEPEPAVAVTPAPPTGQAAATSEPAPLAETAPAPATAPFAGFAEFAKKNIWALAGAAGVLALLLAYFMTGRNRRDEAEVEDKLLATGGDDNEPVAETAAADAGDVTLTEAPGEPAKDPGGDTSFLSEFSPSDINALQDETGEVDPVSEADVYIAYGRYPQAEDLLRQALAKEPERLALKHKLLEVYYAMRNQESFLELSRDMMKSGQDSVDGQAWNRVKRMGNDLMPDNPLFEGVVEEPAPVDTIRLDAPVVTADGGNDDDLVLDDLELTSLASDLQDDEESGARSDLETDISLDLGDELGLDDDSLQVESGESLESLDLDLPELDSEQLDGDLQNPAFGSMDAITDPGVDEIEAVADLDTTSGGSDDFELSAEDLQAQLDELSDLSVLDADLSDMIDDSGMSMDIPVDSNDLPESLDTPAADAMADTLTGLDTPSADNAPDAAVLDEPISLDAVMDLDLGEGGSEEVTLEDIESLGVDDGDEVTTKLELAQAYIEMGDRDGARSILREVQDEGSDEQKTEAGRLLGGIG